MNIVESFKSLVENERESHNYPKPRPPSELIGDKTLSEHLKNCVVCRINFNHSNGRMPPSKDEHGYFCSHSFG